MVINKEPQIVEYYSGLPEYATMIDKLNKEYFDLLEENKNLLVENRKKLNRDEENKKMYRGNTNPLIYFVIIIIVITELTILLICVTFI